MKNAGVRADALRDQMVGLLPRLRRFALGLARDTDRADDLVQAACERALQRLDQLEEGTRLDSWLYRIVYTRWIDTVRRRKTRSGKLILLSEESRSATQSTDSNERLDVALDLQNALNSLQKEHLAAIMLICVEGYSYAEAASVLEVPSGTVASRVARARSALGELLYNESAQILQVDKHGKNGGIK